MSDLSRMMDMLAEAEKRATAAEEDAQRWKARYQVCESEKHELEDRIADLEEDLRDGHGGGNSEELAMYKKLAEELQEEMQNKNNTIMEQMEQISDLEEELEEGKGGSGGLSKKTADLLSKEKDLAQQEYEALLQEKALLQEMYKVMDSNRRELQNR